VELADSVCTGLQLANFWQDVAADFERGRIYLPQAHCRRAGYGEEMFARLEYNPAFRKLLSEEVDRAEEYLLAGRPLVDLVPRELRHDIALFIQGGLGILERIRAADYNVWRARPKLCRWDRVKIFASSLWQAHGARRTGDAG
jgi:phytoene/squalene synthetase